MHVTTFFTVVYFPGTELYRIAQSLGYFDNARYDVQRDYVNVGEGPYDFGLETLTALKKKAIKEFAFTKLFTCGYCGSGISAEEKWKPLKNGTLAHYIYYGCSRGVDRNCKNKYIREEELITELLKILDKVNINELGMRQKLEDEIARFNIFQRSVLGSTDKVKNREDMDIRNYAKYILKEGSVSEKRELLGNLSRALRRRPRCSFH